MQNKNVAHTTHKVRKRDSECLASKGPSSIMLVWQKIDKDPMYGEHDLLL